VYQRLVMLFCLDSLSFCASRHGKDGFVHQWRWLREEIGCDVVPITTIPVGFASFCKVVVVEGRGPAVAAPDVAVSTTINIWDVQHPEAPCCRCNLSISAESQGGQHCPGSDFVALSCMPYFWFSSQECAQHCPRIVMKRCCLLDLSQELLWSTIWGNIASARVFNLGSTLVQTARRSSNVCSAFSVAYFSGLYAFCSAVAGDRRFGTSWYSVRSCENFGVVSAGRRRSRQSAGRFHRILCSLQCEQDALLRFHGVQALLSTVDETRVPHTGLSAVSYRGDGKIVASAGWDGKLRVFHATKRTPLAVLNAHAGTAHCLSFAKPDETEVFGCGGVLASGGKDGRIVVYSVFPRSKK
jgi:WD40 repeat protein